MASRSNWFLRVTFGWIIYPFCILELNLLQSLFKKIIFIYYLKNRNHVYLNFLFKCIVEKTIKWHDSKSLSLMVKCCLLWLYLKVSLIIPPFSPIHLQVFIIDLLYTTSTSDQSRKGFHCFRRKPIETFLKEIGKLIHACFLCNFKYWRVTLLIKKHVCDWFGCIYTVFKCRGHVEMTSIMGVVLFRLLN